MSPEIDPKLKIKALLSVTQWINNRERNCSTQTFAWFLLFLLSFLPLYVPFLSYLRPPPHWWHALSVERAAAVG